MKLKILKLHFNQQDDDLTLIRCFIKMSSFPVYVYSKVFAFISLGLTLQYWELTLTTKMLIKTKKNSF